MGTKINQLEVDAGTASAPAIKWNGGSTGFYRKAQAIFFSLLGTRTLGFLSSGTLVRAGSIAALGATNQTLTVAQLLAGLVQGTPTGAAAYTTPTAAQLDAMIPDPAVGDWFEVVVLNTSGGANTITITGGNNVTVRGNAAVAQNKAARLVFIRTAATPTWDCWSMPCA